MQSIEFNGTPWLASITETPTGLFMKAAGTFTLPVGHHFELTRGFNTFVVVVVDCVRCPAGENETWLRLAIESGPTAARAGKSRGRRTQW